MAYEKIGFNKGDVLKAEHLNHMEEGISEIKVFDLHCEPSTDDTTIVFSPVSYYEEAYSALSSGKNVLFFLHFNLYGSPMILTPFLTAATRLGEENTIVTYFAAPIGEIQLLVVMIAPNGTVTFEETPLV